MIPIVDTHQHLWDLNRFDLPWTRADPAYLPLARSFSVDDYAKATLGSGIERSVYMEVDAAVEQQATEAHHVLDLCRRADTPLAGAVLPGHPGTPGFRELVARFKDDPFAKGVRQVPQDSTPAQRSQALIAYSKREFSLKSPNSLKFVSAGFP